MPGIYFIAAGKSSRNRQRSLDTSFSVRQLRQYIGPPVLASLEKWFRLDEPIYVWGATERKAAELSQVQAGEYAVDVMNKTVVQVFTFCFAYKSSDHRLQRFIKWDEEKPKDARRPWPYVYFLRDPKPTRHVQKSFFQNAFGLAKNAQWLVGQRYFNSREVEAALERTSSSSVEELLGIDGGARPIPNAAMQLTLPAKQRRSESTESIEASPIPQLVVEMPPEFEAAADLVRRLRFQKQHTERNHEAIVEELFRALGYEPLDEIRFQQGRMDILISSNDKPLITIEVKADWALSSENKQYIEQAFRYANEFGTPLVIVTNGDKYIVYDRRRGLDYESQLVGDFKLTNLTQRGMGILETLRKSELT